MARMTLADKAGLMFQTMLPPGATGAADAARQLVQGQRITHVNLMHLPAPAEAARWTNAVQRIAADTPLGIPVTFSTDPRHAVTDNVGAALADGTFSLWPEPLGLAAIGDLDVIRTFADIARREYLAVGIRAALHPTVDLATEPRWARQFHTFGQDPDVVGAFAVAYLEGFQGSASGELTAASVACTTKHFPGGGPQADGEDAHFPYGKDQIYPGNRFADHLRPFRDAVKAGTSAIMPYYGRPVGVTVNGEAIEEVGFGFNRQIITGLLREQLGFDGVIVTDWGLITDAVIGGKPLPARAWGVEHLSAEERMVRVLEAGCDQFGGEASPEILIDLVERGVVAESRIDESVRRLLKVKFDLGLFDHPYVDEDAAEGIVANEEFVRLGQEAQSASVTPLQNDPHVRIGRDSRVYAEGVDLGVLAEFAAVVDRPEDADLILVRTRAPYEPRDEFFLEDRFSAGSLDFSDSEVGHIRELSRHAPVILDVYLDRPAILTPMIDLAAVITGSFGCGDRALLNVLTGRAEARGHLPFELPRSMEAVRRSAPDVSSDTEDPLFRVGHAVALSQTAAS